MLLSCDSILLCSAGVSTDFCTVFSASFNTVILAASCKSASVSRWQEVFKDPMTTAAAIDRLVHHSVILELNVESYRAQAARDRTDKRKTEEDKKDNDRDKSDR